MHASNLRRLLTAAMNHPSRTVLTMISNDSNDSKVTGQELVMQSDLPANIDVRTEGSELLLSGDY